MINTDRLEAESLDEYIWRLGRAKNTGDLDFNWNQIADLINESFGLVYTESVYRKRFKAMQRSMSVPVDITDFDENVKLRLLEFERAKQKIRDERTAFRRGLREDARFDEFCETLLNTVEKAKPIECPEIERETPSNKAVYAMLSDVHYGICFSSSAGEYSPEIACRRVMEYADYIISLGVREDTDTCYVSLMGDMISGQIHPGIRVENRENVIGQVIGVSLLVTEFLRKLSGYYKHIYVNSVDGNHSRIEHDLKSDIRGERLDALIPWYCSTALSNIPSIEFISNTLDSSIANFEIFGKNYVSVHGDLDTDRKAAVHKIRDLCPFRVDYFLAGHMHVPEMLFDNTSFIRNGAVVSPGDDYTMRNRLFAPPRQVCMVVNSKGVESVHPVTLR